MPTGPTGHARAARHAPCSPPLSHRSTSARDSRLRLPRSQLHVGERHVTEQCVLMAWLGQWSNSASTSWSFLVCVYLVITFCTGHAGIGGGARKTFWTAFLVAAHVYVWGLALLTCMIPAANGQLSFAVSGSCWLVGDAIYAFFVPLVAYELFAVGVLAYTLLRMQLLKGFTAPHDASRHRSTASTGLAEPAGTIEKAVARVVAFTLTFLGQYMWSTVSQLYNWANPSNEPAWIAFAATITMSSIGLLNASVWFAVYLTSWANLAALAQGEVPPELLRSVVDDEMDTDAHRRTQPPPGAEPKRTSTGFFGDGLRIAPQYPPNGP